jgi:PPM family protein phosphatase
MKVPANLRVGVCSHAGLVRAGNEDDYLLAAGGPGGPFLGAIADGMGGLAGGAEASRTALRALGQCVLDGSSRASLADRMREGFAAASERVLAASREVPALRDMGTTMTALCLADGALAIGHVGDTRAYRRRGGALTALTEDHAVRQPDNLLTRCIGAGQATVEADLQTVDVAVGDRFLLVSDGVWGVLPRSQLARLCEHESAQAVAESLVAEALLLGGPDNATVVVIDVLSTEAASSAEVDLPRDERPDDRRLWPRAQSLRPPLWPWFVLLLAAALLVRAGLRAWFGAGAGGAWF